MKENNVLLVVPRMVEKDGDGYVMPIGLAYISAVLKQNKLNTFCLNLNNVEEADIHEELENAIVNNKINIVGCGGFSHHCNAIKDVFDQVKKINADIITLAGGAIITTEPLIMSQYLGCDFGVIGEGEETTVELMKNIQDGESDYSKISGLVYRADGENYVSTGAKKTFVDVETLPIPDYKGLGMKDYLNRNFPDSSFSSMDSPRSIALFGSRSCPFKCTFCYHSVGNQFRMRSVGAIIDEIRYYIEEFGVNSVGFLDDVLFVDENRMNELCKELKKLNMKFGCQLRVDIVNSDMLKKLKDSGCVGISYGLESHCQLILDSMKKHIKIADMDRALSLTHDAGLYIQGNFIFGDPLETLDTAMETLSWHYKNRKYHINTTMIYTAPGAEIYEYAVNKKIIGDVLDFIVQREYVVNLTPMGNEIHKALEYFIMAYHRFLSKPYVPRIENSFRSNDDASFSVISTCQHCGEKNEHKNVIHRVDEYQSQIVLHCKKCYRRYLFVLYKEKPGILGKLKHYSKFTFMRFATWSIFSCLRMFPHKMREKLLMAFGKIAKPMYDSRKRWA